MRNNYPPKISRIPYSEREREKKGKKKNFQTRHDKPRPLQLEMQHTQETRHCLWMLMGGRIMQGERRP